MITDYKYKGTEYYSSIVPFAMQNCFEDEWVGRRNSRTQLRSKWSVGPNMAMFNKHNPYSAEEFFYKYTNDYNPNDAHDKKCGRSVEQLWDVAKEWKSRIEKRNPYSNIPLEKYMDMVVLHVIVETYIGGESERYLKENILKYCPDCKIVDFGPSFDSDYAIDIVVISDNVVQKLIQVKPISTFMSKNKDTMLDVEGFEEKNQKGLDFLRNKGYIVRNNTKVTYMLYDKYNEDSWYYNPLDNRRPFSFSLNELKDKAFVEKIKKQGSRKIWEEEKK